MQKLKLGSKDLAKENIQKLSTIFPNVVKEGKVDFELLKQILSDYLIDGCKERYGLNWVGKKESILKANTSLNKTLRPVVEKSVDFENTKNLYIEGDNFEALKIIQESYLNSIKMIYIDPPYNTGKDFIYKDNFTKNKAEYEEEIEAIDEQGVKLYKNTDSNGRFHSDWLSMMYERLLIARDLLKEDGVIFISIDDNEVHNLRHICDEIFGEGNFVAQFVWRKRTGANDAKKFVSNDHEYILCYSKQDSFSLRGIEKDFSNYKNPDNDPRGEWAVDNLTCNKTASERPNLFYDIVDPKTGIVYKCNPNRVWAYEKSRMNQLISEGKIIFPKNPNGTPMYKRHKSEVKSSFKPISSLLGDFLNANSTKQLRNIIGGQYFDHPKSIDLIKILLKQSTSKSDIILDFFSGSATTAHAVMELNAEDGGDRQFIMVQIPEIIDEKSEAYKAGYKTICDIGRERIIRAAEKLRMENEELRIDMGFRYFRIDTSNFKESKDISEIDQNNLFEDVDNIKPDRNELDLLFEVILNLGLKLTLNIKTKEILNKKVYFVENNLLIACFDSNVDENLAKELAKFKPQKIVLKDNSFKTDNDKINFEETLKELSPESDIWVV